MNYMNLKSNYDSFQNYGGDMEHYYFVAKYVILNVYLVKSKNEENS